MDQLHKHVGETIQSLQSEDAPSEFEADHPELPVLLIPGPSGPVWLHLQLQLHLHLQLQLQLQLGCLTLSTVQVL